MAHATSDPRSYGSDDTHTLPSTPPTGQAETREEYIARVVSEAPPISDEVLDRIAVLLRPRAARTAATPIITVAEYQNWEIRRHLQEAEAPGLHGYFTAEDAA